MPGNVPRGPSVIEKETLRFRNRTRANRRGEDDGVDVCKDGYALPKVGRGPYYIEGALRTHQLNLPGVEETTIDKAGFASLVVPGPCPEVWGARFVRTFCSVWSVTFRFLFN